MMPEYKLVRLFAVLSSVLVLSGCSMLNFLNVDAVDDNVNYQKTASSVKALAIPPGLSDPGFDDTYASVQTQSGLSTSVQSNSTSLASSEPVRQSSSVSSTLASGSVQSDSAPAVVSSRPAPAAPSSASSGRGVSLGAALLEQSESEVAATPATNTSSRNVGAGSSSTQAKQASTATASRPATTASNRARSSGYPQVAMMRLNSGEPALAVNAPFTRAWSSLAPILPSIGFEITKQQSDQGIYTTRYNGKASANLQPGKTYLVLVAENASRQSFIGVADNNGKPAGDPIANEVLGKLKAEFER